MKRDRFWRAGSPARAFSILDRDEKTTLARQLDGDVRMMKAVIFDLGNVLVFFDAARAAKRLAREGGVPFWKVVWHFFTSPTEKAYTCGKISSREFYLQAKRGLGLRMDFKTFRRIWNGIFWKNPGMDRLLVRLKKKGYPIYLISNTNAMHFAYIRKRYPALLRPIDRLFPSHQVGFRKPDPRIFKKVLRSVRLKPHETIFIDDVPQFVQAARAVGMDAIRFRSREKLAGDLAKRGVFL